MTEYPLGDIIRNKDANGRIVKWAMKLCPFSLEFASRTTRKSQALVDFIVEWTDLSTPTSQGPDEYWKMYFDGYRVVVVTEYPLGDIIHNKDANGRIVKWAMELCSFSLEFTSRTTIKSLALVDFIIEWTELSTPASQGPVEYWNMYFDGSLNIDGAGVGVLFVSPSKEQLRYVLRIYFPASNNAAEYEACLHGLRIVVELGVKHLYVYGDSALVINQLNKD